MSTIESEVAPLRLSADGGVLEMLDQRALPFEERWLPMITSVDVAQGIADMVIRGAPAIGIAAAFGVALATAEACADGATRDDLMTHLEPSLERLAEARPTAVNLVWALERCRRVIAEALADGVAVDAMASLVWREAETIWRDDRAHNVRMGRFGAQLLPEGVRVLTHCNTGGLATGGFGTALGVIRVAHAEGKLDRVWVDETRPYLQGSRLTAWECLQDGLPAVLVTDSMAGHLMQRGVVDAVIVGADRVAANGDVANKIGTYSLAVLCAHHDIPFYVAAPWSTVDLAVAHGGAIPIEQRAGREVTEVRGQGIAPAGIDVIHPAFDMTPAALITALVTERGVVRAPWDVGLQAMAQMSE